MQRAAAVIDVGSVRIHPELLHLGAELLEDQRREQIPGAMTAIEDDAHALEADVTEALLRVFDVTSPRVIDAGGLADRRADHPAALRPREHLRLDPCLQVVRELVAVGSENLQPVVLKRIVRGRDHHACAAAHALREVGDRRRRHRTHQEDVHARGNQSAGERRLEHVAGDARILADDDPVAVGTLGPQDLGNRLTYAKGDFGRDRILIRRATNAVRTEEFVGHGAITREKHHLLKFK